MTADSIFHNAHIFNTYFRKFFPGVLILKEGRVLYVGDSVPEGIECESVTDLGGAYVIPGFVDSHMHIESSMITPSSYADAVVTRGVTTVVSEPHEIANVFGLEGVNAMIAAGEKQDKLDIYYAIPSSVPCSDETVETPGGVINLEDVAELVKNDKVKCLGEVMDSRGVISKPDLKANQFIRYLREHRPELPIEGHCPRLVDLDLARYVYAGINSDHTEHTLEEVRQRFFQGVFIQLQDKMLRDEIIKLVCDNNLYEFCCFATDDIITDELIHTGHIDHLVKQAIGMGMRPEDAVYCATHTPAVRMNLRDRGELSPGKLADLVVIDDPYTLNILKTYKKGVLVYDRDNPVRSTPQKGLFPSKFYDSVHLKPLTADDFILRAPKAEGDVRCRAIEVYRDRTQTGEVVLPFPVRDGVVDWEHRGIMQAVVFERHGKNGGKGVGFACGDVHKEGAVATTYAHDHHNLMVLGSNAADMALAANCVLENKGGMCVVKDGEILARVALPVAGIMSEESAETVGRDVGNIKESLRRLGYLHYEPVMSLCTISLEVSPELKITDKGLVRVSGMKMVDVFAE